MKSSTETKVIEQQILAKWQEPSWEQVISERNSDWASLAKKSGAMQRQRNLKGAGSLLRLVLAYAVCDWSLRLVGMWAALQGIASLSDVALLYRFRRCHRWLGLLVVRVLQQRNVELSQSGGVRVRLIDATVISRPGSKGTDWRIHVSFDLEKMCLDGLDISDAQGRESLARFPARSDEIQMVDRMYAIASSLGHCLSSTARLVARIGWNNLRLKTTLGQRLVIPEWLSTLKGPTERLVQMTTPQGDFTLRLIACPLPPAKAQAARERVSAQARKKGKQLNPKTYLAAGFVLLLTNLPADTWEMTRVLWLYRLRWQIELQFKHLKSLLSLDHLRAQDPRLVQTYLLGKLLAALLLDQWLQRTRTQCPECFASTHRPLSLWRLHALLCLALRDLIVGHLSLERTLASFPVLQRYLCDSPRSRRQQLACARSILARLHGI